MSGRPCARARSSAPWTGDRWTAYANYTYIDAVYLSTFMEPSPFNPLADANGLIPITNGTPIAGIPKNTVKVGVDYSVTDNWKVGADMVAASGQVIFGNENGALHNSRAMPSWRAHVLSGRQAIADLWPYSEHFRSALLLRLAVCSTSLRCPTPRPFLTDPRTFGPGKPI